MPEDRRDSNEQILTDHGDSVWCVIVRLLGAADPDAADCFQQTFLEFLARCRLGKEIRNAEALLKRIAAARAVDILRRRIRDRRRIQRCDTVIIPAPRSLEPESEVQSSEFLAELREALAELPQPQSAALVLTQIEELPHAVAAQSLGVTLNHLGVLLYRARTALSRRLEDSPWLSPTWRSESPRPKRSVRSW